MWPILGCDRIFLSKFWVISMMKYIFAGNWLEYNAYVQRHENGFIEISKVEHMEKIEKGGVLYVLGSYQKRRSWLDIERLAKAKNIRICELD